MSPVRDGSRDGSAPAARTCPECRKSPPSSRARYCSAACRQRAYRDRRRRPDPTTGRRALRPSRAQTIYECPHCEARYVGQQRCPDCGRFCRRLGSGGACPQCDEPVTVSELLGEEVLV